jgi:hypothetical protein
VPVEGPQIHHPQVPQAGQKTSSQGAPANSTPQSSTPALMPTCARLYSTSTIRIPIATLWHFPLLQRRAMIAVWPKRFVEPYIPTHAPDLRARQPGL